MKRNRFGFTLIELLIVVAIIAILAAIAVPNFLEAQTRAKISRVRSDIRTINTAIEAYAVDYNNPAPSAGEIAGAGGVPPTGAFGGLTLFGVAGQTGILGPWVTTPIAYLTNFILIDPFVATDTAIRPDERLYSYHTYPWRWPKHLPTRADSTPDGGNEPLTGAQFKEAYGMYRIFSIGPDKSYFNRVSPTDGSMRNVGRPYDSTNGTVSIGNIIRSQRETEQKTFYPLIN